MSRLLSFATGVVTGIYLQQNYHIPDVMKIYNEKVKPLIPEIEKRESKEK